MQGETGQRFRSCLPEPQSRLGRSPARPALAARVTRTLWVAVLLVAVFALVGELVVGLMAARGESRRRMETLARVGADHLVDAEPADFQRKAVGTTAGGPSNDPPAIRRFREWSAALMREDGVVATAVIASDGDVLASWPSAVDLAGVLRPPIDDRAASYGLEGNSLLAGATVAVWPIDRGPLAQPTVYAVVIGRMHSSLRQVALQAAAIGVGLLVVSIVVASAGVKRLERSVFRPLTDLSRSTAIAAEAARHLRLPRERTDELEAIARNVQDLCAELEQAQHRADQLEKSIDSVVARETSLISQQLRRAERDAEIDTLTRLANRRFIEAHLDQLVAEHVSLGASLAVVMFDVDDFKPLNDQAGHACGDGILRFVGELLRGSLRDGDVGVRYGGDEFAVILTNVTPAQARGIAERVVRLFAQRTATMNLPARVTLSAGVATLAGVQEKSGKALIEKADAALYQAKRHGKNEVCGADSR